MPTIAIYARKSTESDDRQVLSIDSQVRELREYAARQGFLIDQVFTESKSAKSLGRPVFGQVMQLVEKRKIDQLVCWKLDRLARNPIDGGVLIWALDQGKLTAIHTPQQIFDGSGNSKFWMQLEFGMAKKYVDDLADNVKRGLKAKVEQGWLPCRPPIGYLNDRNTRTIVPDPERFMLVRKMWELMLSGNYSPLKVWEIATEDWKLTTRGTKRQGGRAIARSYVYKLFRQPFYYGMILRKGLFFPGAHKPMISKDDFDEVQEMLEKANTPRPKRHKFPFTGLMQCGECGGIITAEHKIQRHGHRYIYYHCTKRRLPGRTCSQRVIEEKELERQVLGFLNSITLSKAIVDWVAWLLQELYHDEVEQEKAQLESLRRRQDGLQNELNVLTGLRLRDLIGDEEYAERKSDLHIEQFKVRELMSDNHNRFEQVNDMVIDSFRFAERARARFDSGTMDQKRAVLRYTSSNLVLMDRKIRINAHEPFFFIQKALEDSATRNLSIKPPPLGELQRKIADPTAAMQKFQRLVAQVRTYFLKHGPLPAGDGSCSQTSTID